jgi:hypothetical protein
MLLRYATRLRSIFNASGTKKRMNLPADDKYKISGLKILHSGAFFFQR